MKSTQVANSSSLIIFFLRFCFEIGSERVYSIISLRTEHVCTTIVASAVELHELCDIKFGLLQYFHLADVHIFQRENTFALLLNLFPDGIWNKLLDQVSELSRGRLGLHDLNHLLSNL